MLHVSNEPGGLHTPLELRRGQRVRVLHPRRDVELVTRLELALDPWARLRGLLGHAPLGEREGLLLRPCTGVHTLFMRFTIDVAFLDPQGRVVHACPRLRPWRVSPIVGEACCVLELCAGRLARSGTEPGDRLRFVVSFDPRPHAVYPLQKNT